MAKTKTKSAGSKKARKPLRVSIHGESIDFELRLDTSATSDEFEDMLRKLSTALPKGTPPPVETPVNGVGGDPQRMVEFIATNAAVLSDEMLDLAIETLNAVKSSRAPSPA